jgi:hypothetical protein
LRVVIAFVLFMLIVFTLETLIDNLSLFSHFCLVGGVAGVAHILIGCVLNYTGLISDTGSFDFCDYLFLFFVIHIIMTGVNRLFCRDIPVLQWLNLILMDALMTPGPCLVGYLSGILTGVLYRFHVLSYVAPGPQFFRMVEKRLFWNGLHGLRYLPAAEERGPIEIEDELYSPERFGDFRCSFARRPDSGGPVCFRRQICYCGEMVGVSTLEYESRVASVCIPSSIEVIKSSPGECKYAALPGLAVVFEWGSTLRQIASSSFRRANIRSLCVPASLRTFLDNYVVSPGLVGVLSFESGSRLTRLNRSLSLALHAQFTMLPMSLESIDASWFDRCNWHEPAVYAIEPGNRHFTVAAGAIMNFARTSVIRYFGETPIAPLDSMVKELAPLSFAHLPIESFTFGEPSQLRLIGHDAFTGCNRLGSIAIPSTVEVIAKRAFCYCEALQEVRIGARSRLRLIGRGAFEGSPCLQPVDVPWFATIRGCFEVMATVYDEDGSKRTRVRFISLIKRL